MSIDAANNPRRDKIFWASAFVLTLVAAITYHPALGLNFYGDDYSFLEKAGRSTLGEYLAFYFDPRAQTGWYRPMQGMLFGIEWLAFGSSPLGYHVVNALVHACNVLLVFATVSRLTHRLFLSFLSALIWLGLPLFGVTVFWPGDADFLLTFFYLLSILFWILYLPEKERRWQIPSFLAFLLALTTKEFGVTIPLTLFLIDRLILRAPEQASPGLLSARYAPFLVVYAIYLPLELYIQSSSVLTNQYGYGVGPQILQNLVGYLAALAFPWVLPEPFNLIWLALAAIVLVGACLARKSVMPAVLIVLAIIAFVPVLPFPWFFQRYLYSAVVISAIMLAWLANAVRGKFPTRWFSLIASAAIATIILRNGLGVATAAAEFAEIGRQTRVPFRDFTQRHSNLPPDTLIYFINPPTITSQLSGMFFLRYGAGVHVAGDDGATRAGLRAYQTAYLVYFDEERRTREIAVQKNLLAQANKPLPLNFGGSTLKDWELANDHPKPGQAVALILYWDTPIEANVGLVDAAAGHVVADSSGRARGPVADARILAVPPDARPGNYRIEVTAPGSVKFVIEPIIVSE